MSPQYSPQEAHRIQARAAQARAVDRQKATQVRAETAAAAAAIHAKADTAVAAAVRDASAPFLSEVKRLISQPVTQWSGGPGTTVVVNHWKTPTLASHGTAEPGPLVRLSRGKSPVRESSLIAEVSPTLLSTERGREWLAASEEAVAEVKQDYPILPRLADREFVAGVLDAAGITRRETEKKPRQTLYGSMDQPVTTVHVPVLSDVTVSADGLQLTFRHTMGQSARDWNGKIDTIRAALLNAGAPARGLTIRENGKGDIVLSLNDRDPFESISMLESVYDAERGRSLLGVTSTGQDSWISWRGSSGMVIGGVPGSGKTASMLPVFAAMTGHCELHVFDGKSGYDLHPLRHIARTYNRSGDGGAPLATLRMLDELRTLRADALHKSLGQNNFWNVPLEKRESLGMTPVFLILDEVQTWLDTSGKDKDEKAESAEIIRLVRTLIQKSRSVGIVTVLTTQKPDATSVPTVIRDNAALKLSFRVSTPEQAICVLGRQSDGAPDPTQIPMSAKGRFVMETEGSGIVLGQAGYAPPDVLDEKLSGVEPVRDQRDVACEILGVNPNPVPSPSPEPSPSPPPEPSPEPSAPSPPASPSPVSAMTAEERDKEIRRIARERGWLTEDDSPDDSPDDHRARLNALLTDDDPGVPNPLLSPDGSVGDF